jgi:hypothetical protein
MSDLMQPAGQSTVRWEGAVGMVQQQDRRYVEFFRGQELNGARSQAEARPIYEPVDMVKIIHPGERDVHVMPVREHHKFEFARQWAAYQAGMSDEAQSGTPIATLYPNEPALVKQFQALHIYTAEQMAGLTEQGIMRLGMGGRAHVDRAQKFLEHAEKMSGASHLQRELDAERERREALEEKVILMERQLAVLAEGKRRTRRDEPNEGEG